jgi:uncharacterized protein YndB with AHSA1/START domain
MSADETVVERRSDRELVVTRVVKAPARLVFKAWTTPELMRRWWAPASFGITFLDCEMDVRTGGSYRFVFGHPAAEQPMAFFGTYIEVVPDQRIVWTNAESGEAGQVSTLTLTEADGVTTLVLHDLYPSKAALDEALETGSNGAWPEQFDALEGLLAERDL